MRIRKCGVYMIRHIPTGRCYIGSSIDISNRWYRHRHSLRKGRHHSRFLQRSWSKYGQQEFEFILLEETGYDNRIEREQFWIDSIRPRFNVALIAGAPQTGRSRQPESKQTREKRSASALAAFAKDPSLRFRVSAVHIGKKRSAETVEKMRSAHKKRAENPELRKRISEKLKGHPVSEETRAKISNARAKQVFTPEQITKRNAAIKAAWARKAAKEQAE